MTTMTTAELTAKLNELKGVNPIQEQIEVMQLQAKVNRLTDPVLVASQAKAQLMANSIELLTQLRTDCEKVVESSPVFDQTRNENTRYNGNPSYYGVGNTVELVSAIANGVQYARREHKSIMQELVPTKPAYLSALSEAMGSPSYFSKRTATIVPAKPYNLADINTFLNAIEDDLNVVIDRKLLTEEVLSSIFTKAEEKARADAMAVIKANQHANSTTTQDLISVLS